MPHTSGTKLFVRSLTLSGMLLTISAFGAGALLLVAHMVGLKLGALLLIVGLAAMVLSIVAARKTIWVWADEVELVRNKAKLMTDATTEGVWLFNPALKETYFSKHLRAQFGITGKADMDALLFMVDPDDAERARDLWQGLLTNAAPFSTELKLLTSYGGTKWYRWSGRSSFTHGSKEKDRIYFGAMACTHEMREVEESVNDIALLAVENPNPVFRVNLDGVVMIANRSATPLLDSWEIGAGGAIPSSLMHLLTPVFEGGQQFEMEFACGDQLYGALFVPHIPKGYVNVYCTDVTERAKANKALDENRRALHELNEKMRFMAQHDVLTQLPNRALFEDRITVAIERGKRYGTITALMMIDLDRFKHINDTHGHDAGDTVLVTVSNRLMTCVRGSDTVARLGGDEFAIVLTDLQEDENAVGIANKIIASVSEPIFHNGIELHTSPSIGITYHPSRGAVRMDELYKQADLAMYLAKKAGRNTFKIFSEDMAPTC